MPEIRIADEAGACYGVERALQMVETAAAEERPGSVHTLGPLIHNPRVIQGLAEKGVDAVDSPEEAAGDRRRPATPCSFALTERSPRRRLEPASSARECSTRLVPS